MKPAQWRYVLEEEVLEQNYNYQNSEQRSNRLLTGKPQHKCSDLLDKIQSVEYFTARSGYRTQKENTWIKSATDVRWLNTCNSAGYIKNNSRWHQSSLPMWRLRFIWAVSLYSGDGHAVNITTVHRKNLEKEIKNVEEIMNIGFKCIRLLSLNGQEKWSILMKCGIYYSPIQYKSFNYKNFTLEWLIHHFKTIFGGGLSISQFWVWNWCEGYLQFKNIAVTSEDNRRNCAGIEISLYF